MTYVIEFRNGSYLANLDAERGVPMEQAMRFATRDEAERLMREHFWISFWGGMVVEDLVLVHADGGACHGTRLRDGRCPACGIAPDTQSTELWPPGRAK